MSCHLRTSYCLSWERGHNRLYVPGYRKGWFLSVFTFSLADCCDAQHILVKCLFNNKTGLSSCFVERFSGLADFVFNFISPTVPITSQTDTMKGGNFVSEMLCPSGESRVSCSKLSSGLFHWENPAQLSWGWEYPAPEKKYFPLTGGLFLPTALLSPLTAPSWSQHFFKNSGILVIQSSAPHHTEGHICRLRNSVKVMKRMRCPRGSDTSKNLTLNEFSEIFHNTEKRIKCWNLIQTEKSTRNRKDACSTL